MPKLWLTYAWKDNEDQDVDHIISVLRSRGIEVNFDRAHLLAGRRLWEQIDAAISDPDLDAWAILTTEHSLSSEPCLEEIAYALDRTLRTRGHDFPLIGIFPRPVDRAILPSALATRLYVNLRSTDWADQIVRALTGAPHAEQAAPSPFGMAQHERPDMNGAKVLEVWPRTGRWAPFVVLVPQAERAKLRTVLTGPRGFISGTGMISTGDISTPDGHAGIIVHNPVDADTSGQIFFEEWPTSVTFGPVQGQTYTLTTG